MRKPKFKIGDKVKVLRASTKAEQHLWMDSWMPLMNDVVGKVMTIGYVNPNDGIRNDNLYPKYTLKNTSCYFPEFVLQKYSEAGRQLLFGFME